MSDYNPTDYSPPGSSVGFCRKEYWHGLPFPPPVDLLNSGVKPWSPALQAYSLLSVPRPVDYFKLN